MQNPHQQSLIGLSCALIAYLIWGLCPVYLKALAAVPAFEILMHRIIWSFLFLVPLLLLYKRWHTFTSALKNLRTLSILSSSTILIGINWFVFIWAINNDRILQASLGYYINPIVNVLLGMVFLKERLRPLQIVAAVLAGIATLYLTVYQGEFPWIALALAFSFGFYGLIRKVAPVEAMEGLAVETLILSMPATAYLFYLDHVGTGVLFHTGIKIDLLLMGTILITAIPLILFTIGARRLHLTTIGFLQYIAPSGNFLLAIFVYHEPLAMAQLWTFITIWVALVIFSTDAALFYRKKSSLQFMPQGALKT